MQKNQLSELSLYDINPFCDLKGTRHKNPPIFVWGMSQPAVLSTPFKIQEYFPFRLNRDPFKRSLSLFVANPRFCLDN